MSLLRSISETDPLLTLRRRTGLPEAMEREIVDGGVREGRLESPDDPGMFYLAIILIVLFLAVSLAFKFIDCGFPQQERSARGRLRGGHRIPTLRAGGP